MGGGGVVEANGDVPLDGVAISLTGLTIMGSHFQQSYQKGIPHFRVNLG